MSGLNTFKKVAPVALSILGVVGVAVTTALAVKTTRKIDISLGEDTDKVGAKEIVKEHWKEYLPVAGVGAATAICIVGSSILSQKNQAILVSGYSLLKEFSEKYQNEVRKQYGDEAHEKIVEAIMRADCNFEGITGYTICGGSNLGIDGSKELEVVRTFYEPMTKRYFQSTLSNVLQAEYHTNRNYALCGEAFLADFYDFLGIDIPKEDIDVAEHLVWDRTEGMDGIYWIDFAHTLTTDINGNNEVVVIQMIFEPDLVY